MESMDSMDSQNQDKVRGIVEKIKTGELVGRKALEALAATRQCVFHGSSQLIEQLEPRQAYNEGKPDGEPAVFAARDEAFELAIFRALFQNGRTQFSTQGKAVDKGDWGFGADESARKNITSKAYVYVFLKTDFQEDTRFQWKRYESIKPLIIIPVHPEDAPVNIRNI